MRTTERAGAHSLQFGTYALRAAGLLAALAVRPVPSCMISIARRVNDQALSDVCQGHVAVTVPPEPAARHAGAAARRAGVPEDADAATAATGSGDRKQSGPAGHSGAYREQSLLRTCAARPVCDAGRSPVACCSAVGAGCEPGAGTAGRKKGETR